VAPAGWTAEFVGNALTATFAGPFNPGDTAEFAFDVRVGDLPRPSDEVSYTPIVNSACVTERETDTDPSDNCASDVTPVKSIAVIADAVCVNDTPLASYSVTPSNVGSLPTIAMVWWTQDAYENRDPEIDASDTAALLADGASKVDPIEVPVGWTNGTKIEGRILWPGAEVDADGNPIAWPGWTQKADGTWVLDPEAPFYNLRGEAVMEIRINPSSSAVVVYPPATPNCAAEPPTVDPPEPPTPPTPPTPTPPAGTLSTTGADTDAALMAGAGLLLLLGSLAVLIHRRRSGLRDSS
jgi:LPXTG-motif cell wall-anchored protein